VVETVPHRTERAARTTPPGLPSEAEILGRAASENFTVATRLLPGAARRHLLAVYGYARLVDQLGDAYGGDRLAALDWVDAELDTALGPDLTAPVNRLIAAAAAMVRERGTGEDELRKLVAANRLDQGRDRYATFDALIGYCRLSADPVGRLVLIAFGASTPERVAWSDRICTGLQLAEHWQDVAEDTRAGRIYLPGEDLDRFGVTEDELHHAAATGGPASAALRGLLAFESARARALLHAGAPLVRSLRGRTRVAVAGFAAGGHAALDAIAGAGFDPWAGAPRPRPARVARHLAQALAPVGTGAR
jgi:squalene synthase HpnC